MKNDKLLSSTILFLGFLFLGCQEAKKVALPQKKNILFIIVDDLRPQLGAYGKKGMITPNMDKLAASGVLFENAYCQQAICGPSRASFLTGIRPSNSGITSNYTELRRQLPEVITMPQYFKQMGYNTLSLGKVFHRRDPISWSETEWVPEAEFFPIYTTEKNMKRQRERLNNGESPNLDKTTWWAQKETFIRIDILEKAVGDGKQLFDYQVAEKAIEELNSVGQKPFFLAVGFFRPHLPYIAPQKYYHLYPEEEIVFEDDMTPPEGVPEVALHSSKIVFRYEDTPAEPNLNADLRKKLAQGYYASVSFVDAQIGRVLDELEKTRLDKNTIVVLIGDHGYHHGEHGIWDKMTNFETGTRVPLIVRAPGEQLTNAKTKAITELVDIFPTVCELSGNPIPENLDGQSAAPLIKGQTSAIKKMAFSQFPRNGAMGKSVRTGRYRLTLWEDEKHNEVARELYDYESDPKEGKNQAFDEALSAEMEKLEMALKKVFDKPNPE